MSTRGHKPKADASAIGYKDSTGEAVFLLKVEDTDLWYTDGEKALVAWETAHIDVPASLYVGRSPSLLKQIR